MEEEGEVSAGSEPAGDPGEVKGGKDHEKKRGRKK